MSMYKSVQPWFSSSSDNTMFVVASCLYFVLAISSVAGYHYETKKFEVPVDHFSYSNNDTFTIRYLINNTFWRQPDGPIFFYTGNEGAIETFCENTGFMWDIAPEFKAAVVFAEHRYYGDSLPYGNKSFSNPRYSGYLTTQQTLADFVDLIRFLTSGQKPNRRSPVIAFGGSYGGMLAAYIRMKYPHVIQGAIAASAPIWSFTGMTSCLAFNRIITSDFRAADKSCSDLIRRSWGAFDNVSSTDEGLAWLNNNWKLCDALKTKQDVEGLKDWLTGAYGNLAMSNYPYAANFMKPLPGSPISEFCSRAKGPDDSPRNILSSLRQGVNLYFNFTGESKCLTLNDDLGGIDGSGWDFQACTEMVMPMCSDGVNDMFQPVPWDFRKFSDECFSKFQLRPDPYLAEKTYGGKNIQAASNIIFSNGLLDPWSSGGVLKTLSKTLISVLIPEGAHHLDLRASHIDDPASVIKARELYRQFITYWIS